jgi:hypothetical protein
MPDKRIPYEKGISLEEAHADTRAALAGRVFIPYPEPPSLSTSGIMIPTYMRPYFESRGVAFKSNAPEEFYNAMYVSEHNSDGKRVPDRNTMAGMLQVTCLHPTKQAIHQAMYWASIKQSSRHLVAKVESMFVALALQGLILLIMVMLMWTILEHIAAMRMTTLILIQCSCNFLITQ